jgi:hypothetical protein
MVLALVGLAAKQARLTELQEEVVVALEPSPVWRERQVALRLVVTYLRPLVVEVRERQEVWKKSWAQLQC